MGGYCYETVLKRGHKKAGKIGYLELEEKLMFQQLGKMGEKN